MKKLFLQFMGWLFLGLAILGAFLPLLPTTPFALLALACFSRSSPRMADWILNHRWMGPPIQRWKHNKTISPMVKVWAISVLAMSMIITGYTTWSRPWLFWPLLLGCLVLSTFLLRLPTQRQEEGQISGS